MGKTKRATDEINLSLARVETFLSVVCEGQLPKEAHAALASAHAECDRIRDRLRIIRNSAEGI
jgi:hypothetical protein